MNDKRPVQGFMGMPPTFKRTMHYPYPNALHDTPFDPNHRFLRGKTKPWPMWMDKGYDGAGFGISLYRSHPTSSLRGNVNRNVHHRSDLFIKMVRGVLHPTGKKFIRKHGKVVNPSLLPFVFGEPDSLYYWKVTDPNVVRTFDVPSVEGKEAMTYKPYVALQEREILGESATKPDAESKSVARRSDQEESTANKLSKRLFFWR